ncbi:MAG: 4-alpha-glucanotransferase, partial [Planctomycetota bacterium]
YIGLDPASADSLDEPHWRMLRTAFASVADWAVAPAQDVLGLDSAARMNRPGEVDPRNWSWRLTRAEFDRLRGEPVRDRLRDLVWRYGRL